MSKKPFKLLIATPFYEVKGYSPYISSLINSTKALSMAGIEWEYLEHSGDSYVDRAKNTIAHTFMDSSCTHVFMIDSDLGWEPKGFLRLVKAAMAGAEIIGATFPNKNNWDSYGVLPVIRDNSYFGIEKDGMRLLEVRCMPGGFLIYSKTAFEVTHGAVNTYYNPTNDLDNIDRKYHEYFRCDISSSGGRMGEDIYFQNKYRDTGGTILLEPDVSFTHWGVKGWKGNYNDYLLKKKAEKVIEEKKVVMEDEKCQIELLHK